MEIIKRVVEEYARRLTGKLVPAAAYRTMSDRLLHDGGGGEGGKVRQNMEEIFLLFGNYFFGTIMSMLF